MDGMLRLIERYNIKAADVDRVEVGGNQSNYDTLFRHHPSTGLEGKFSMEYCMAIFLLERKATLNQVHRRRRQRPDVQNYPSREILRGPGIRQASAAASHCRPCWSRKHPQVYMKDGKSFRSTVAAKGSPRNPMTFNEVADKFRATPNLPSGRCRSGVGHRTCEISRERTRHEAG